MPAQPSVQHIPLSGGMNEKTPREMLPPEQLSYVRNGRWRQPGMVETRLGYTTLATNVLSGGTLPTSFFDRLLVRDDELCRLNEKGIYSYSAETAKWTKRDKVPEMHLAYDRRLSTYANSNWFFPDMAVLANGMFCIAWQDSQFPAASVVHAAVFGANGQLIVRSQLRTTSHRPRVVAVGSTFIVVWGDTGANDLYASTIDGTNPTAFSAPAVIVGDCQGTPPANWDISACATYFVVAYQDNTLDLKVRRFSAALSNTHSNAAPGFNVTIVAAYVDPNALDVYVAWHSTASGNTESRRYAADLASVVWTATPTIAGATGNYLTVGANPSSTNIIVARQGAATVGCEWVFKLKSSGATSGVLHTNHNVRIASKIFADAGGTGEAFLCVYVAVDENEQQGLVCCGLGVGNEGDADYRLRPVAKWLTGKVYRNPAVGLDINQLPQVSGRTVGAGGIYYVAFPELDQGTANRGSHIGVTRFDLRADNRWARLEDRNTALVAGAMLYGYDGDQLSEIPYAWYPYLTTLAVGDVTSTLPTGTYDYIVCYEWTDARGRVHRSKPSLAKSQAVTVNVSKARLIIKNLTVTSRTDVESGFRSPVALAVYRRGPGAAATDPYVRLGSVSGGSTDQVLTLNDPLTETTAFDDSGSGAWTTSGQPFLYTNGGILPGAPPSSCRVLTRWDGRIWLGGCEVARSIWYSRELVEDEPPYFHENQQIMCEEDVTALASFDSALIVFSANAIWAMQGRGPNDRGEGSTYTGLIKLPAEVGCSDWRSMCVTEAGVFFQHRPGEGIYLLDRALSLQYIGASIETHAAFTYPTVTSAVAVPSEDEVRFSATNDTMGRLLVYNTLVKQWMVHELYRALELDPRDAIMWAGAYVFCKDTRVAQQSALYQDYDTAAVLGRAIPLEIVTGDIALAGPLARARTWRAVFLGRRISGAHGIEVSVAYDQADTYADTKQWSTAEVSAWAALPNEAFEVVAKSRQEARSVRFSVKSLLTTADAQSVGFMALALESGVEQGVAVLPEAQKR
jgi:hypothetical protein